MSKKYGLGKGLSALIPDDIIEQTNVNDLLIDLNLIRANNEQPRKYFDEEKINNLAQSISEHGIIQPLVLNKEGEFYYIIAGERRWRAAKRLGLKEVPAVVMNLSHRDVLEVSLIENVQREDLNPIEEAIAYDKLFSEFNLTQEELSLKIGKSRVSISNCLRLLNLDKRVQEYLIDSVISEGHGRALLGLEDKELQYNISKNIIDEGLNVRQTEALVREIIKNSLNKEVTEIETKKQNPYHLEIKNKLESHFGTKVLMSNNKNRGKIQIEYYSEDDLQRIIDILKL
ncbi:MAG: ParB/RepB/Spo0J family partition protein [Clostridiaceae bacterium]|nr:ParB/RepB/Spo0J family partition protein [Clostridiaceae bacterium]